MVKWKNLKRFIRSTKNGVYRQTVELDSKGYYYKLQVQGNGDLRIIIMADIGFNNEPVRCGSRTVRAKNWTRTEAEAKSKVLVLLEKEVAALRRRKTKLYQMMEQYR